MYESSAQSKNENMESQRRALERNVPQENGLERVINTLSGEHDDRQTSPKKVTSALQANG